MSTPHNFEQFAQNVSAAATPPVQSTPNTSLMNGGRHIILPSGEVSISSSAAELFGIIAPTHELFTRGGMIMEVINGPNGSLALEIVKPSGFRSRIERFGKVVAWRIGANGEKVLKPTNCPEETAKALMDTKETRNLLPPIATILNCAIVIEDAGVLTVLKDGYHAAHGGILVTRNGEPPEIELAVAVAQLKDLLVDFDFQTPADHARALACLITPALKMGGFIQGPVPIDVAEADQSQSGKTYRQRITAAIYGEKPTPIAPRKGGVGSVDESFAQALISAKPFIQLDNFRDKLDSPYIESFLTADTVFAARVPHRGEVQIDPRKFFIMLSSNGVETTPDLANRSCIIRIRKRNGAAFRSFAEGDLLAHVVANQQRYLGCVFAIIRQWVKEGKLITTVTDHDFREWAQKLDWISHNVFAAGPLLDGHRTAQKRVCSPALNFLRNLCYAVQSAGQLSSQLSATKLVEICEAHNIPIHGLKAADERHAGRQIGILMKQAFGTDTRLEIDGFTVTRSESSLPRAGGGNYPAKSYFFEEPKSSTGAQGAQDPEPLEKYRYFSESNAACAATALLHKTHASGVGHQYVPHLH